MSADPKELKAALRAEVRARLAALSHEDRRRAAGELCERLRISPGWRVADSILFFAPLPDEPDVWPLLAVALGDGKTIGLPRYDAAAARYEARHVRDLARDLEIGKFQIREPARACPKLELSSFNLVLVPGVAFDWRGRRLGRGRGFYDRLLAEMRALKCGVAFEEQIVAGLPSEVHDMRMDALVTPGQWREFGTRDCGED